MKTTLPLFLSKLRIIVDTVSPSVGTWSTDGNSFTVLDSDKFERILQKHYKGNLQTFVRQLHFYAFSKVVGSGATWSFHHEFFRRDHPHLIYDIKRKTRTDKGDGVASELEVKMLRSQVTMLQEKMTDMLAKFETMKNELDTVKQNQKKRSFAATAPTTTSFLTGTTMFKQPTVKKQRQISMTFSKMERTTSTSSQISLGSFLNGPCLSPVGNMKRGTSLDMLPLMDFDDVSSDDSTFTDDLMDDEIADTKPVQRLHSVTLPRAVTVGR